MSADVHSLSGAYAVWALDDAERAEFERHLAACAECREEVASLREAAATLADSASTPPPASLRAGVLGEIGSIRPLPPVQEPTPIRSRRRPVVWLGSMAAAVALIVGALVWRPWAEDLSPAARVMAADDARSYSKVVDGATVQVWRSESLGRAVVVAKNMTPAPAGHDYQLWLQVPDERTGSRMVSAGLMPHRDGASVTAVLTGDAAQAIGAGITVEPAGGSKQPTTTPIALFEF